MTAEVLDYRINQIKHITGVDILDDESLDIALYELIRRYSNLKKENIKIRAKAIDEFAEKLKETLNAYIEDAKDEGDYTYIEPFEISKRAVKEVAEQLKAGVKYDNL